MATTTRDTTPVLDHVGHHAAVRGARRRRHGRCRRGRRRGHRPDGGGAAERGRPVGDGARSRTLRPGRHRLHERPPHDGDRHPAARADVAVRHQPRPGGLGRRAGRGGPDRRAGAAARHRRRLRVGGRLPAPAPAAPTVTERRVCSTTRRWPPRWASTPSSSRRCRSPDARASGSPARRGCIPAGISAAWRVRSPQTASGSTSTAKSRHSPMTPRSLTANGHKVACGDIVIATHNPLVGLSSTAVGHPVPDQARPLHHLCRRRAGRQGDRARRSLVGHRRPVPLPARRAAPRLRPGDLRR